MALMIGLGLAVLAMRAARAAGGSARLREPRGSPRRREPEVPEHLATEASGGAVDG